MRTVSASSGQSISHGRQNQQVRLASKARPQAMQRAASFWASSGVRTCSVTAVRLLSATGSRVRLPRGTPLERSRWGSKSLHQPFPAISSRAKYIYDYSEERFFCQVQRRFFTGQRQEKERGRSWMLRPLPYGINE